MRLRYTLTRQAAMHEFARMIAEHPDWRAWYGDDTWTLSPTAAYRQTFQAGGATARKSRRGDRWAIIYGMG